jgi:hypothetical protein
MRAWRIACLAIVVSLILACSCADSVDSTVGSGGTTASGGAGATTASGGAGATTASGGGGCHYGYPYDPDCGCFGYEWYSDCFCDCGGTLVEFTFEDESCNYVYSSECPEGAGGSGGDAGAPGWLPLSCETTNTYKICGP